ncbi:Dynein light chain 1, cytoplasmic [Camellia lanceoleosa]|uniref:Dynein light chain 1, cytoplasmic n=1 Tax=Camellia lanceoleosa TaxID=1840588 RepID=A0ACC0HF91_9ERIC|nr:Dynein light chain 1, cytoplasmic [Camellia lanceoleosa]
MRFNAGALVLKPSADDRKLSAAVEAKKVIIKSADMKDDLQKEAIDIAISAFEKHNVEKDVAEQIKKEFDRKHGPTWHCIVGKNFDLGLFGNLTSLFLHDRSCNRWQLHFNSSKQIPKLMVVDFSASWCGPASS